MNSSTDDMTGVPAEQWTDAQLVQRTHAGEIEAFGTLYERRWSMVYQAAKRVTRSHDDALDVTSSVFADVLEKAQAGRLKPDRPSLAGYLSTAAKNAALDLVQRARTLQTTDTSELPEASPSASDAPELDYGPSELLSLFRAFLSALDHNCAHVSLMPQAAFL